MYFSFDLSSRSSFVFFFTYFCSTRSRQVEKGSSSVATRTVQKTLQGLLNQKKKTVWAEIAQHLQQNNYDLDSSKCERTLINMKSKYKLESRYTTEKVVMI